MATRDESGDEPSCGDDGDDGLFGVTVDDDADAFADAEHAAFASCALDFAASVVAWARLRRMDMVVVRASEGFWGKVPPVIGVGVMSQ